MIEYDEYFPMPPQSVRRYKMIPEKEYEEQRAYIDRLEKAFLEAESAAQYYETCLSEAEADNAIVFFGWPGRKYQAFSDKKLAEGYRKDAHESLDRIKAGNHDKSFNPNHST